MIDTNAIVIFYQVAQSLSFTEASRKLDIPISSVSRKVSELESSLNTLLIDRSKRQIQLTEAGSTYFELCRKGIETLNYANKIMDSRHKDTSGTITITVPPNLISVLFMPTIETFQSRYPKAKLRVLISEHTLDFTEDEIDLSFRVYQTKQPNLVTKTLMTYKHHLVASRHFASINDLPKHPSDLLNFRCIGFSSQSNKNVTWKLSRDNESEHIDVESNLSFNDYDAISSAIKAGYGIGELPEPLCAKAIRNGDLVKVLPEWAFPDIKLSAVHTGRKTLPKLASIFLDILITNLQTKQIN